MRAEVWLLLIWGALFSLGVTGYPNLLDNERRIGAFALDVLQNGNWIAQHEITGEFMAKPPGLTWLVVLFSWCTGGLTLFSLYLPSALATLGIALLIFRTGRKHFGERAGLLAAFMYLCSYVADKQLTTARYDGLLTLPVTIGAIAAYQGWKEGKGWLVFWVAMTAGTMVKGPLVFVLSCAGLLAVMMERNTGQLFRWRWQHAAGIAIFGVICGGWFALILVEHRDEFFGKIIQRELVGHALSDRGKYFPGERIWEAPWNVLVHFLPWTPLGIMGLVGALRRNPADPDKSFQRFLACWFLFGLFLFSIAAHQRGRLLWPLIPPLALLAGRTLALMLSSITERVVYRWAAIVGVVTISASALFHQILKRHSRKCQQTLAMRELAGMLRRELGEKPAVTYVDAPFAVQFYLGHLRFNTPATNAANLLNGANAAHILTGQRSAEHVLSGVTNQVFSLYVWPSQNEPTVQLLSNRRALTTK